MTNFSGFGSSGDGKISGVCTVKGGSYDDFRVDGVCTVSGDLEANRMHIEGVCTCEGNVAAKRFDCNGVLTINGNVKAGEVDVDGVVTVRGTKLEADRLVCDGVLTIKGEISADFIEADGKISADEIVGDHIVIKSYWKKGIAKLLFGIGRKINRFRFSEIKLIEATTVELRDVLAVSVSGRDVIIGSNCEIERVDCSGTLYIHPTAKVGEVTGEYTVVSHV